MIATIGMLVGIVATGPAGADGTETLGPPSIPIAAGNGTVIGGVGLRNAQPADIVLDVPSDVTVEQVLVYWEGHSSSELAGFDDDIELDGTNVQGTLIGGPTYFFGTNYSSTYRADITSLGLVSPGLNTISVGGLNYDLRNNGAGILVITSDGGAASELTILDGTDLAFIGFPSPRDATVPQTITFAAAAADRMATIDIFASSVAGQDPPGERPNYILVTVDGVVTQFDNVLGSFAGEEWDAITLDVNIPAGATSLTVQAVSGDPAEVPTGNLPASLAWNAAAINVPVPPKPEIAIEKATNGFDADGPNDPDVPEIAPGDPITWTYVVTNTGDVPFDISEVDVTDDIIGDITGIVDQGDGDDTLAPGESWTYEASGTAADLDSPPPGVVVVDGCGNLDFPGDRATYENVGTVVVPGTSDSDPSHYCNPEDPGIDIEKLTNGNQADGANDADVPEIAPGDPVTWTYIVTNTGDVAFDIAEVSVTDDIIGPITGIVDQGDGDDTLAPGESWTYEATAVAGAEDLTSPSVGTVVVPGCNPGGGQAPGDRATYENVGTVTVPGDSDDDPSHYCNPPDPGIDIEKATNGADADGANDADVPEIAPGDPVTWTYVVTNTGDVGFDISDVAVTDDIIGAITGIIDQGDGDDTLAPGESWTYEASAVTGAEDLTSPSLGTVVVPGCNPGGGAIPGDRATYENVGTVTVPGDSDDDPSHYCNPPGDPGIDIEKLVDGNDADDPDGVDVPILTPGSTVTFTYLVTNTGAVPFAAADVDVTDDIPGVTPVRDLGSDVGADGVLSPGEVWTYTASSTVDDLQSPSIGTVVVDGCNPTFEEVPGPRNTYENIGTVMVPGDSDSDPGHYCNPPNPGIEIEKLTNGADADGANDADVPEITPGDPVTWIYIVTNTGDIAFDISEVVVTDDIVGTITDIVDPGSDGDEFLEPGETWVYRFVAPNGAEDLANPSAGTVVVQGCNPDGTTVPGDRNTYENIGSVSVPGDSDSDPSHYCNPPDPGIDIEKLTNGNQADGANDADVPEIAPGDLVTWTYIVTNTGDVGFDISDVTVTDDIIGPITGIVDQGDGDDTLSPGESWTYQALGQAVDLTQPPPGVVVDDGCGTIADPGDRPTYANVGSVIVPGDADNDPSHYCNPPAEPDIDIEKYTLVVPTSVGDDLCESLGKPAQLTMRYTGGGPDASSSSQGDKLKVSGDPNSASPVYIVSSENSNASGKTWFAGSVELDGTFVIDPTSQGQDKLKGDTHVTIFASEGGPVLQTIEFHTSCSQPLNLGDIYGGIQLIGFVDEDGGSATLPTPNPADIGEDADTPTGPQASAGDTIQWTYLVTNTGEVALDDVEVRDDNGTPGDGSDDFAPDPVTEAGVNVGDDNDDGFLDPGEVWVYRATGTAVLGQYGNLGDVIASPVNGRPDVTDSDPSHYFAVFDEDICEAFDKPVRLIMRYTGDGPDGTSHSQDPGKVSVSGDPNDASPVIIEVNGDTIGQVALGETFDILDIGGETEVVIRSLGGQVLQEVEFHTSCSQPLRVGDQYGAVELVDSVDKNGQGPSNPNFTGLLVEKLEFKKDKVKAKIRNTGSSDAAIDRIEITFPSANGELKKVKAGSEYKPSPTLGSPATIAASDFDDPDKAEVEADDDLNVEFEFTDDNDDPSAGDYTIVIHFTDGSVLEVT